MTSEPRSCPSCGEPLPAGRLACPWCGELLASVEGALPRQPPATPPQVLARPEPTSAPVEPAALPGLAGPTEPPTPLGTAEPPAPLRTAEPPEAAEPAEPVEMSESVASPAPVEPPEAAEPAEPPGPVEPPRPPVPLALAESMSAPGPEVAPAPGIGIAPAPGPEAPPAAPARIPGAYIPPSTIQSSPVADEPARVSRPVPLPPGEPLTVPGPATAAVGSVGVAQAGIVLAGGSVEARLRPEVGAGPPGAAPPGLPPAAGGPEASLGRAAFVVPADIAGRLVAIAAPIAAFSFLLPFAAAGSIVVGGGPGSDYFGDWGLASIGNLVPFGLAILLFVLAVVPSGLADWFRFGVLPLVLGGALAAIGWVQLTWPGGYGPGIAVLLAAAILLVAAGGLAVRNAAVTPSVE